MIHDVTILFDGGGASVSGASMSVGLKPLPAPTYTVRWHVLSVDTHKTEGGFTLGRDSGTTPSGRREASVIE